MKGLKIIKKKKKNLSFPIHFAFGVPYSYISEMEELIADIQRSLLNPAKCCVLVLGVFAREHFNFSDWDSWLMHIFLAV